jgi:hypothetical protein
MLGGQGAATFDWLLHEELDDAEGWLHTAINFSH